MLWQSLVSMAGRGWKRCLHSTHGSVTDHSRSNIAAQRKTAAHQHDGWSSLARRKIARWHEENIARWHNGHSSFVQKDSLLGRGSLFHFVCWPIQFGLHACEIQLSKEVTQLLCIGFQCNESRYFFWDLYYIILMQQEVFKRAKSKLRWIELIYAILYLRILVCLN